MLGIYLNYPKTAILSLDKYLMRIIARVLPGYMRRQTLGNLPDSGRLPRLAAHKNYAKPRNDDLKR
jgi:hypothetical protein